MMKRLVIMAIAFAIPCGLGAQVSQVKLDKTRRPLSEAVDLLEHKYGWIITYEDVPVVGTDIDDITPQVRPRTPNAPYRTLVPKGTPFGFSLDEDKAKAPSQEGAPAVIAAALDAYNKSGNPGQFRGLATRVPGGPMVYHLIPYEMRDEHGQTKAYTPLLDTRISVPARKRSLDAALTEICQQLKTLTGVKFDWGPYAANYVRQNDVEFESRNEVARDVLRRLLIEQSRRPLSWWMFCDPHGDLCSLNVHFVGTIHP